jgi:hypothetical protein
MAVRVSANSASGSVRVAVRTVVCGSVLKRTAAATAQLPCALPYTVVRQCGSVRQCMAVCDSAATLYSCACVAVWQCPVVRQ